MGGAPSAPFSLALGLALYDPPLPSRHRRLRVRAADILEGLISNVSREQATIPTELASRHLRNEPCNDTIRLYVTHANNKEQTQTGLLYNLMEARTGEMCTTTTTTNY